MGMTPKEVVDYAKKNGAVMVDIKFIDYPGVWQHFTIPISELDEDIFENGLGFDGSSIRGWQPIHASDMLVVPDPATAIMDPVPAHPTLSLICNIVDPITKENYSRDPRNIAQKAVAYLQSSGLGDTAYFGPEAEFFIFDDVRFDQTSNEAFYSVDSIEGRWNTGTDEAPNLGYKPRHKEGYFPVPPTDSIHDLRSEIVLNLEKVGMRIECHHHEVATGGQCEIDMRFDDMMTMADQLMWFKYIIKNVALKHGRSVTFMPKPLFDDNGSGMHTHMSLWKGDTNTFAGDKYGGVSQEALYYIGGILKHARSTCAFTNPTTNSYRRLVPGFEAPVNLAYSSRNRSASVRIPMIATNPKAKRIEFRTPDPSCNPYLAFAAMLMAGIDGIENKIDPGQPLDKNIYALAPEELKDIPSVPGSLEEALKDLQKDQAYLKKGDVFTQDAIDMWIDYKTQEEVDPMKLRPTPYEFSLYYDI